MKAITLKLPLDKAQISALKAGDFVLLEGSMLTGRDAAHKRLFDCIQRAQQLPVSLQGETIYYVGPCTRGDEIISAGPTTSMRMDDYATTLYDAGVVATIGKGERSLQVREAIKRNGALYLCAIGGAGALYADSIKRSVVVAYPDLGTEAVRRLEVEKFAVIVAIDSQGRSIFDKTE